MPLRPIFLQLLRRLVIFIESPFPVFLLPVLAPPAGSISQYQRRAEVTQSAPDKYRKSSVTMLTWL